MSDELEVNPILSTDPAAEDSAPTGSQPIARESATCQPDTLLQLVDGSMYGLTDYWLEGDRLHYVTNYGGENSVPLERIDLGKTQQLNADQGTNFDPHPKPPAALQ